ncbi:hypothetical protein Ccrd_007855 [Cynara cardunculus var. scolymus]|uniref:Uncharacterized protein n=1 Tax=Cynara cardunculus var. scolymus TaxID=59895 RepID=A0A103XG43_CYNCS|nr:hypothetical protein Ccrd_007855 [Cynara cardunculus var. scolymus]
MEGHWFLVWFSTNMAENGEEKQKARKTDGDEVSVVVMKKKMPTPPENKSIHLSALNSNVGRDSGFTASQRRYLPFNLTSSPLTFTCDKIRNWNG